MNANTDIDINDLHAAIISDIKAQFPDLLTVEFYRGEGADDRKTLATPACLLSLTEFEASVDDDPESEQLAVIAHFDAELVVSFKTERAKLSIRHLAAAMAAFLHKRRWNNQAVPGKKLPTGPCVVVGAYRDDFSGITPGQVGNPLDQFECWRVEWRQIVHLGNTIWDDSGVTPTPAFSWYPRVGNGNKEGYEGI